MMDRNWVIADTVWTMGENGRERKPCDNYVKLVYFEFNDSI
jgi:hypothetical protein